MVAPDVSVIMTVYNGEQYLEQAIKSIQQQTLTNFEFVIVDDGSNDRTPEILAEKSENDPRIKVISGHRIGRAKALNTAWKNTTGQHIANMDADDLCEHTRLEKQLAYFQQHPEVGLLGTAHKYLNQFYSGLENEIDYYPPLEDKELRHALLRFNPFAHSSVMIPRHVLIEQNGYNEYLRVSIDYDLWVRIASHYAIAMLPDILEVQRIHQASFFSSIHAWEKYLVLIEIRWHAWRRFSRNIFELRFILDPLHLPQDLVRSMIPQLAITYHRLIKR